MYLSSKSLCSAWISIFGLFSPNLQLELHCPWIALALLLGQACPNYSMKGCVSAACMIQPFNCLKTDIWLSESSIVCCCCSQMNLYGHACARWNIEYIKTWEQILSTSDLTLQKSPISALKWDFSSKYIII